MEQCVRLSVQPDTVSVTMSEVQVQGVGVLVYVSLDESELLVCDSIEKKKERQTVKMSKNDVKSNYIKLISCSCVHHFLRMS